MESIWSFIADAMMWILIPVSILFVVATFMLYSYSGDSSKKTKRKTKVAPSKSKR